MPGDKPTDFVVKSAAALGQLLEDAKIDHRDLAALLGMDNRTARALVKGQRFPRHPEFVVAVVAAVSPGDSTPRSTFPEYGEFAKNHPVTLKVAEHLARHIAEQGYGAAAGRPGPRRKPLPGAIAAPPEVPVAGRSRASFIEAMQKLGPARSTRYWNEVLDGRQPFPADRETIGKVAELTGDPPHLLWTLAYEEVRMAVNPSDALLAHLVEAVARPLADTTRSARHAKAVAKNFAELDRPSELDVVMNAVKQGASPLALCTAAEVDPGLGLGLLLGLERPSGHERAIAALLRAVGAELTPRTMFKASTGPVALKPLRRSRKVANPANLARPKVGEFPTGQGDTDKHLDAILAWYNAWVARPTLVKLVMQARSCSRAAAQKYISRWRDQKVDGRSAEMLAAAGEEIARLMKVAKQTGLGQAQRDQLERDLAAARRATDELRATAWVPAYLYRADGRYYAHGDLADQLEGLDPELDR